MALRIVVTLEAQTVVGLIGFALLFKDAALAVS